MSLRNWGDEHLTRAFQDIYCRPDAFWRTPQWKKWTVGLACLVCLLIGLGAFAEMVRRVPPVIALLLIPGAIGLWILWLIIRSEREYFRQREQILAELIERGLYERASVRIADPQSD